MPHLVNKVKMGSNQYINHMGSQGNAVQVLSGTQSKIASSMTMNNIALNKMPGIYDKLIQVNESNVSATANGVRSSTIEE